MKISPARLNIENTRTSARDVALLDALLASRLSVSARKQTICDLFGKFTTLRQIVHAPGRSLRAITKNGDIAHEEIQKARKLAIALARVEIANRPVLDHNDAVINYCRTLLAGERRELFYALLLNKANKLVCTHCLQSGTIDHVSVYPREIFDLAMEHSAAAIILVHNHPSGSPIPSRGDIQMTRILAHVGHYLGVKLKDHIIIANKGSYSFLDRNEVVLRHGFNS